MAMEFDLFKGEYAGFYRYQLFIYHSTLLLLKGIVQEEKEIESDNYDGDGNRTNKYDDNRNKETLYFNQYWVEHVNGTNRA